MRASLVFLHDQTILNFIIASSRHAIGAAEPSTTADHVR